MPFRFGGVQLKKKRAPTPRTGTGHRPKVRLFDRHPSGLIRCSGTLGPFIRSIASAGQFIVNFVMGLMVGDRRFPGATILGASCSTTSANHPVSVPPTGPELPERFLLFWDFGSLYQRRCGVIPYALSRQPYFTSSSLRRPRLGVTAQASGTSLSDISATPDVAASRISRRRATATSTLLTCRGAAATSTPLTRRGAAAISTPL